MKTWIAIAVFVSFSVLAAACADLEPPPAEPATGTAGVSPTTVATLTEETGPAGTPVSEPETAAVETPTVTGSPIATTAPIAAVGVGENFRFLVSDEQNVIGDFASLTVTISRIGVLSKGESGKWLQFDPLNTEVDLTTLQGDNAQVIWSGNLPDGPYGKVFIYVEDTRGVLEATGETVEVKLPSNKLQMTKSFEVTSDSVLNFVYDLTVIAAGNVKSGIKYILKPQAGESGAERPFKEVKARGSERDEKDDKALRVRLEGDELPGATVELRVTTQEGVNVADAEVTVNGEPIGVTSADGVVDYEVPLDAEELKVVATLGDREGELELELEVEDDEVELTELEGIILAVTEGEPNSSPWTLDVQGLEAPVTVFVTDLDGTPGVGLRAEVEGRLEDGVTLFDARAEVQDAHGVEAAVGEGHEADADIDEDHQADADADEDHQANADLEEEDEAKVDRDEDDEGESERDEDDEVEAEGRLEIRLEGDPVPGARVLVKVTLDDSPAGGAEVTVNSESIGRTSADGTIEYEIPLDAEELEVEARLGKWEGELELDLD